MLHPENLERVRLEMERARQETEKDVESFWNGLSYDDKVKAFYAVSKRIYKADVEDKGSYRYALYDIFGFNADVYALGMYCHYFDLHNLLHYSVNNERRGETDVGV